jgi:hypothetical protein
VNGVRLRIVVGPLGIAADPGVRRANKCLDIVVHFDGTRLRRLRQNKIVHLGRIEDPIGPRDEARQQTEVAALLRGIDPFEEHDERAALAIPYLRPERLPLFVPGP